MRGPINGRLKNLHFGEKSTSDIRPSVPELLALHVFSDLF